MLIFLTAKMNPTLTAEQIYEQYPLDKKCEIIELCKNFNIDTMILIKAICFPHFNDFEYVYNLLELPFCHKNFSYKCTNSIAHPSFFTILNKVSNFHSYFNDLSKKYKMKLDKRDVIGLVMPLRGEPHDTLQIIRVLKKYGLSKCMLYSRRLTSLPNVVVLRDAFQMICINEPIYAIIYQTYSKGVYQRFYDLHKQLLPKIRRYVSFRDGCKLLLSMCEETQNGVDATNLPTTDDYIFGNDYLLNRIARFL